MENINNYSMFVAVALVIVSLRLYFVHRTKGYQGNFKEDNVYTNVSALKHDMSKALFVELFPALVYGLFAEGPFFDTQNIMGSKLTNMGIIVMAYFVFYELVQPHFVNRLPAM